MLGISRKRSAEVLRDDASSAYHYDNSAPKSGKWTAEEETFAKKLIIDFEAGNLTDCAEGCTLRAYLSRKLNCAPMRISKKYAGQCIGKHAYVRKLPDDVSGLQNMRQDVNHICRDSDSPSASTSSAASSDSSSISEHDQHAAEARRAEVSYGTLAEFQVFNYPPGGIQYQYARHPVTLVSLHAGGAVHPTPLYPMAHFASGAGVHPAQPWAAFGDQRPCAVVQRPFEQREEEEAGEVEAGEGEDLAVGLDIDNPYQAQNQTKTQGEGYGWGYGYGCGGGLRSVSTDYSCITACSSSSGEDRGFVGRGRSRDRDVSVEAGRRTPEASPNLVSKAIHLWSAAAATATSTCSGGCGQQGQQVVTPVLNTALAGHFAAQARHGAHCAPSASSASSGPGARSGGVTDKTLSFERADRDEAEEWRAVLTYFTSSPRSGTGTGTGNSNPRSGAEGAQTSAEEEEEEAGRLVRRDSSFLLHRNASFSSLFV